MKLKENIRIAIFSIRTNALRSLLTMLGIIIGVAAVIAIITLGNGGRDYIIGMIRAAGQNSISLTVGGGNLSRGDYITQEDIQAIKELESVQAVSPTVVEVASVSTENNGGYGIIFSGNTDLQQVYNLTVEHGAFFSKEDYEAGRSVVLIDKDSAVSYFGYDSPVGEYITVRISKQNVSCKVIGVLNLQQMGENSGVSLINLISSGGGMSPCMLAMPCTTLDVLRGSDGRYEGLYITAKDDSQLDAAGSAAVNTLYTRHNNYDSDKEIYSVVNMATLIDLLETVIRIFTTFIASVSAISLLVGGIGVMNIMLVSVTERTREIGIRKALGAKTGTILFQFLTESVILCAIGGAIGLIIGVSGAFVVASYLKVPIVLQPSTVAIAIGFSSAIGIFFGIYPARRAAKMHPIEALRRE